MRGSLYAGLLLLSGALLAGCSDSTFVNDNLNCDRVHSFSVGDITSGSLDPGDCVLSDGSAVEYYRIRVSGSRRVHALVTSQTINPYVEIVDRNGNVVRNEDTGGSGYSELFANLASGTYYIAVSPYRAGDYGDFELQTEYSDPLPA